MPLGMTRDVATAVWVLKFVHYFEYMSGISHDRFMEIDREAKIIDYLFDFYEMGHMMSASRVLLYMYEFLGDYDDLMPFNEDGFEILDAW